MRISYENQLTLANTSAKWRAKIKEVEFTTKAKFREMWTTDIITDVLMEDILEFGVAKATSKQTGLTRASMIPTVNRGLVLGYLHTTKALISIVDPDQQVITIDGRDYYYGDYAVLENSAAEKLVATSGRIALTPKKMARKEWCVDRIIENYDPSYLVSPSEYAMILNTLFNGGVDHVVRTTTVTPEKEAPKFLTNVEFLLPSEHAKRFDTLVELADKGVKAEAIMTQVMGYVLSKDCNLDNYDVGSCVQAEIRDKVMEYFREIRQNKQPINSNVESTNNKPKYHNEAQSLGEGKDSSNN